MSLREPTLDDRSFQYLVNEARRRVAQRCPEWTDHNVSDPGITLIETFAWMTEVLLYRLNRVPEKLHIALLKLLDIELAPPAAAEADLRFRLVAPAETRVRIPARESEVATEEDDPIVFRVCEDFTIEPVQPSALVLERTEMRDGSPVLTTDGRPVKLLDDVPVADGTAMPTGSDQPAFAVPPDVGDALYLGFDHRLDRLVVRVDVEASPARGVGIDPTLPPLSWEVSQGERFTTADVLEDTTGGFNEGGGSVELQLPERTSATSVAGRHLYWLRCRITELGRDGRPSPRYQRPPHIHSITARATGALLPAEHAVPVEGEVLGESDGTPGQRFTLRNYPALALRDGETLEVCDPGEDEEWVGWERRDSFESSEPGDRHFRFDAASGEVELGPAIRTREGVWRQRGAIPVKGARLRMTGYRHPPGERGATVGRRALTELRNPIAGVESVTNPEPAHGGVGAETLEVARGRAAMKIRARYRAVTAEDFEFLAGEASPRVARARCLSPPAHTAIPVYVLPAARNPGHLLDPDDLEPSAELLEEVADYLDERRLVGTAVHVMPVPLRGVTVAADVVVARSARPDRVQAAVERELYRFLNPVVDDDAGEIDDGWEFGRALNKGELYTLVQEVGGVEEIELLRVYETDLHEPRVPTAPPQDESILLAPNELVCSAAHRVRARYRDDHDQPAAA